jgi:MFS family permease
VSWVGRVKQTLPGGRGSVRFGVAGLVNALGTGLFYPYTLVFFPDLLHLSLAEVGAVLTGSALVALPLLPRIGRLTDRIGAKTILVAASLLRAVAFVGYVTTHGVVLFALFSVVVALGNRAEQAATPVLVVALSTSEQRTRWLALSRTVFNAGLGAGALAGSVLIGVGDDALVALGLANALSFLLAALMLVGLPRVPPRQRPHGRVGRKPWRDSGYLVAVAVNTLLWMVALAVETGLSAYLIDDLGAPPWLTGALFAVNTGLLIVAQLPMTSVLDRWGAVPVLVGGVALSIVFLAVLAAGHWLAGAALIVALTAGMVVYTLGELATTHVRASLLANLPPPGELGSYQAFNQAAAGLSGALVPLGVAALLAAAPALLWWSCAALSAGAAVWLSLARRRLADRAEPAVDSLIVPMLSTRRNNERNYVDTGGELRHHGPGVSVSSK